MHMQLFSPMDGWIGGKLIKKIVMRDLKNPGHAEPGTIFHTYSPEQPGETYNSLVGRVAEKNISQTQLAFRRSLG